MMLYCVCTVCRIVRVLRNHRGNMLLVGMGGSGRRSLTRLAAVICEHKVFEIDTHKNYHQIDFREG